MTFNKLHALAIGINDFPGSGNDLAGCVNDVHDIARLLSPNRATAMNGIDRVPFFHNADSLITLLDSQAKLVPAVEAIGTMLSRLGDNDLGILWFSQHGSYVKDLNGDEPDGMDEVLVFQDFGLWSDDNFSELIRKRNPKSCLFIGTDACHSGTVHRMYVPQNRVPEKRVRYLPPSHFPLTVRPLAANLRVSRTSQAPLPNVVHFAGCQDIEYCYDASFRGRPNGAFTYYLLKALTTLQPGATFGEWFKAVCTYLPSVEYMQTPRCNAKAECLRWRLPLRKG